MIQYQDVAVFLDEHISGSYFLPSNLTGDVYFIFLEHILHGLLEYMSLHVCQNIWFQHDGVPPRFFLQSEVIKINNSGQKWIGCGGPIA